MKFVTPYFIKGKIRRKKRMRIVIDRQLCWIAALLILLLQWLYPRIP